MAKSKSKTPAKKAAVKAPKKQAAAPTASAAPVSTKIESNRPTQNDVTQPSAGTFCSAIWTALDNLHAAGKEISIDAVREIVGSNGSDMTIRTQRQRHKTFHGLPRKKSS